MKRVSGVLRFIWPYTRPYRGRFVWGVILSLVFALSNGFLLLAMKTVFDRLGEADASAEAVVDPEVAAGGWAAIERARHQLQETIASWLPEAGAEPNWQAMGYLVLLLVGASAVRGASNYLSSYCMRWSSEFTIRDLKRAVLAKVQSLSLDYFDQSQKGDLLTRIDLDTVALNKAWGMGLTDLIRQPLTFVVTLAFVVFLVDWRLTVMALIFFPVCVVPVVILGNRVRRYARRSREAGVEQSSRLIDFFSHIRTVKAYGLEKDQGEEYAETSQRIARSNLKRDNAFTLVNPIIETVAALGFCVVLMAAFVLESSLSHLAVFLAGFFLAYTPLKRLASVNSMFQEASVSADRLEAIFHLEPTVKDRSGGKEARPLREAIAFENVSFTYPASPTPVLDAISLRLARGEFLGLAGPSGAGKSTLINLVQRFYDPTRGAILWDGQDLRDFSQSSLRQQIALVGQDVAIFNRSVRDNIAYGRPGATEKEIYEAAEFADADRFIREMPEGYDTRLGEHGVRLSGGQKQRISLARAFLRQAQLLILDEATAALDSEAEGRIQEVINRLAADRAVIAIAHRLATLQEADRILVLDNGKAVECGSYRQLLADGGAFARLAARQGIFADRGGSAR